jgi:hypothetical protein
MLGEKGKIATRLSPPGAGARLDPPPPEGVYWLRFRAGTVPTTTPGNQPWDEVDGMPDPYAVLYMNDEELLRSNTAEDSYEPQWVEPSGNFAIPSNARLEVRMRDADAVGDDLLIGRAIIDPPSAGDLESGRMAIELGQASNRAMVYLETEPAHALMGLGFDYYVQSSRLVVKEVWKHSPAGRGGMKPHDEVVAIGGRKLSQMKDSAIRSAVNAISGAGMEVVLKHADGGTETIILKEGPVYPLYQEYGSLR